MDTSFRGLSLLAALSVTLQFLSGRDEVFLAIDFATTINLLPSLIGDIALWGLYVVVFYTFFQAYVDELASDRRLTTAMALFTVLYAVVMTRQLEWIQFGRGATATVPLESTTTPPFFTEIAVVSIIGCVLICVHTKTNYGTVAFGTPLEELYRSVAPNGDIQALRFIRQQDDWLRTVGTVAAVAAMLSVVLAGSFYLGATTAVAAAFFPLFELFLVGSGVVSVLTATRTNSINIEDDTQRIAQGVFMNFKGLAIAPMILLGIMWALVPLFVGFLEALTALEGLHNSIGIGRPLGNMVADFGFVGFGVLPMIAGGLMLRYWWRSTRRVPTFLRHRRTPGLDATAPVARPPLVLLPAVSLLLIAIVPVTGRTLWQAGYLGDLRYSLWVFAVLWPSCVVAAGYWVYRSRRVSAVSQSIAADQIKLPVAFSVQIGGILIWSGIAGGNSWLIELATGTARQIPEFVWQGLIGAIVVLVIAVTPEIYEWSRTTSTPLVRPGLVAGFAAVGIWLGVSEGNALVVASGAVLVPFAVFSVVLTVMKTSRFPCRMT